MSESYFDSPDYFQATDAERALVIEHDFKKLASKSKEYTQASPQQQDAIRAAYQRNVEAEAVKSPFNPSVSRASAAQSKANNQGFLPNLWDKVIRSHEEGAAVFSLLGDALNPDGTINLDAAKKSAAYFQKQKEAPVLLEEKQLNADMDKRVKEFTHGDASEKVSAVLGGIWDVITNPKGAMYTGTASASTITSAFLGGRAAALAAAGLTAATGGAAAPAAPFIVAAGSTAAVGAHAGVQNWLENMQKDLDAANVPYTEANINAWVEANPDRVLKHQKTALAYGTGMGVLSTASGALAGRVATSVERAALRQAGTTVEASVSKAAISGIAKETGESVEAVTQRLVAREAQNIMSKQTFKSNLLQKGKNLGIEIAGEPAEELGARVVSGQEVTAKDLIMETIGGIGAGPYGAAVNKSLYGTQIAADKTKSFVQKVIASTPESRAAAKAQEAEIKAAKVESASPTNYGFNKDVASTEPTDPKINDWATPGHKSYDPVKAVTVLAKEENPTVDHYDRTRQVYLDYKKSVDELYDTQETQLLQSQALLKAGKTGEAQLAAEAAEKTKVLIETKSKTLQQIADQVNGLKTKLHENSKSNTVPAIDPDTATPEEITDHITKALGSSGNTNSTDNDSIDKLLKRTDITDYQRTMLNDLTAANIARKNVTDLATNKSMDQVRDDIYLGNAGTDFKGVDAYRQGIIHHLEAGRMEEAQKQLDGLKAFRDRHQQKSDDVTSIYNTMVSKGNSDLSVLSDEQRAIYQKRKNENSSFKIHHVQSKRYVPTIQEEARALNAEVKLAESLMAVHKNKGQVVVSPSPISTPTANPASLESTPVSEVKTEHIKSDQSDLNTNIITSKKGSKNDQTEFEFLTEIKAEQKRTKQAKKQKASEERKKVHPEKDDILVAISKLGGIAFKEAAGLWGAMVSNGRKDMNHHVLKQTQRFGHVFKNKGLPIDDMIIGLRDRGYLSTDDHTELEEKIRLATEGKPSISNENEPDVDSAYAEWERKAIENMSEDELELSNEVLDIIDDNIDDITAADQVELDVYVESLSQGEYYGEDHYSEYPESFEGTGQSSTDTNNESSSNIPEKEINNSTDEETSDNLNSIQDDPRYDDLYVGGTDQSYAQTLADLNEEIAEAQAILKCFGTTGGN